jgi:hypothetical protein
MGDHLGCRGRAAFLTRRTAGQALVGKAHAAKDQAAVSAAESTVGDGRPGEPSKANLEEMTRW